MCLHYGIVFAHRAQAGLLLLVVAVVLPVAISDTEELSRSTTIMTKLQCRVRNGDT